MAGIARHFVTVNALVLATLAVGLVNNILIAAVFGLTRRVDAFFGAMMLPTLFMILCVDYLGKNFLPVLAAAKRESEDSAARMTSTIVTIVSIIATAVTAAFVVFSEALFGLLLPGFDAAAAERVNLYFLIMAPSIVLMAVTTFHEYVCQHDERFVQVARNRMALPIVNLGAILALGPFIGEYCLPFGYLAGHAVMFVLMARQADYRFRPCLTVRPQFEKRVLTNSAVVMSTGVIARSKSLITNYLASFLGGGVMTAFALATKLTEPLQRSLFSAAHMFMFARTARLFAARTEAALGRLYGFGLRLSFLVLAPIVWWLVLNSVEVTRLLFARGRFTDEMTLLVASILIALAPSVLFLGVNQLLSNAFYAMNKIKVPALVMPLGTLVYAAAAVPLSRALGAQGLALSTTITSMLICGMLLVLLARRLENLSLRSVLLRLLGYFAIAGTVVLGMQLLIRESGLASPLIVALCVLPLGAATYAFALAVIRDETLLELVTFVRSRMAAGRRVAT